MEKKQARTVRATVGPKVLANVGRYFTNDLRIIADELLQNCRRAGATTVVVTTDHASNEITIADDGRGVPVDDADVLLTFGASSNDEVVEYDEAPAGMGFFSLALRGARVRSKDWQMVVPPNAFTGLEVAAITTGLDEISGTIIAFPAALGRGSERREAEAVFLASARFMPFRTVVDGIEAPRRSLTDWLQASPGHSENGEVEAINATVGDSIVIVARFENRDERFLGRGRPLGDDDDVEGWLDAYADIFGQVLKVPMALITHFVPALEGPAETALMSVIENEKVRWPIVPAYLVIIEALGQNTLKARLPDRGELVRTPELGAVMATIADLVTELAARAARNGVQPNDWPRIIAAQNGVTIPPAQVQAFTSSAGLLRGFELDTGRAPLARRPTLAAIAEGGDTVYRLDEIGPDDGLLQAVDPEPALEQILLRTRSSPRILVSHGGAIDGIDRITKATVVGGDQQAALRVGLPATQELGEWITWPPQVKIVDDLTLEFRTSDGRKLRIPIDFFVGSQGDEGGSSRILTRRSASIAAILQEVLVDPDDAQVRELRRRLTTAMRSHAQAAAEIVRDALLNACLTGVGSGVELVRMQASLDETTGIARLTVEMSDGSKASLDLDPDATAWSD